MPFPQPDASPRSTRLRRNNNFAAADEGAAQIVCDNGAPGDRHMEPTMAEIFLLRHAHAESASTDQIDLARPLSALGRRQAIQAAEWLKPRLRQASILVSPALRCQQTWQEICTVLGDIPKQDVASIYEASPGILLDVLSRHRADQVLLLGHNPGLENTCALLHSGRSSEARGMPTAAVAYLRLAADSPVEPGCAELLEFWWPG